MRYRCLAGCGLAVVLAVLIGLMSGTSEARQPPQVNSIQIAVDASQKGKIVAVGSFTTAQNVTLTKVEVWAYPSNGGVLPAQIEVGAGKIDNQKKSWGPGTIETRVYKGAYSVRADGFFSDQTKVASYYVSPMVDGDAHPESNLTLVWAGGYPQSTVSKKISCKGTFTGNQNAQNIGELIAIPLNGGPHAVGAFTFNQPAAGDWISNQGITVQTGGIPYTVVGTAADNGKNAKWYCTSVRTVTVVP